MKFKDLPRRAADSDKKEIDPAGLEFPVQFELRRPVAANGGADVKTVTLREPTVADVERADAAGTGGHGKMIRLLADLAELAPDDIRKLSAADYRDMSDTVSCFL